MLKHFITRRCRRLQDGGRGFVPNFINIFTLHSYFLIQIIPSGEDAEVQTASPGLHLLWDHLQLWFKWSEISPKAATNNCSSLHHLIVLKLLVLYNQQSKTPKYFLYYVRNQEIFTHKKLEQLNSLLIHLSLQHLSTAVSSWGFLKAPGFWRTAMIFLIFVLYIDNVFVFTWLHETPESLKCLNLKLH